MLRNSTDGANSDEWGRMRLGGSTNQSERKRLG